MFCHAAALARDLWDVFCVLPIICHLTDRLLRLSLCDVADSPVEGSRGPISNVFLTMTYGPKPEVRGKTAQ